WAGRNEMQNLRYLNLPEVFRLGRLADRYKMFGKNRLPDHPEFGPVRNFTYACDELVGSYRKTEQEYTPEIQQGLEKTIKQCIRAYAKDVGRCRFVDKSQSYTLKIPLLRRCLSNPKFVLVARNPFALCARYAQPQRTDRQWRRPPGIERKLEVSIQHWKNTFSIALEDLKGQTDGLVVRFEDFLAAPEPVVRKILNFLELPWEEGLLPSVDDRLPVGSIDGEKWYPFKTDVNRRYLEPLDGSIKKHMEEQLGQVAAALGYE
ncbi:MAG TPA: sulfotransferase, partial [Candidatus Bathyarchaeia archaeon]|nr:sulfotransferase [Candidatus Bathyarchaeia archaeon]